jgi:hypothetical protein
MVQKYEPWFVFPDKSNISFSQIIVHRIPAFLFTAEALRCKGSQRIHCETLRPGFDGIAS